MGLIGTSKPQSNSAGDFLHVPGKGVSIVNGSCLVRPRCCSVQFFAAGPNWLCC